MNNLFIDPSLTYRDILPKLKALKFQYYETLTLFSYITIKTRNNFIRNFKNQIYSLQFEEWKRDRIWEFLNDDIEFETLLMFLK